MGSTDDDSIDTTENVPAINDRILIYWAGVKGYFTDDIESITGDGKHVILHVNEERETLKLSKEIWKL